jgi:hypothetical protein
MSRIVIPNASPAYGLFKSLVRDAKVVILTGLPGVGKSLYVQQLALMAQLAGRETHLLQWDVTRSAFELPEILARYPEVDGVTHAVIRKAVGIWSRSAITNWKQEFASHDHLLIGEATLVGERLMHLAKIIDDSAEDLLRSDKTQFLLPVPSTTIREKIERKRVESIARPQHAHDAKDAPPGVLEMLWHEIYRVGYTLGIIETPQDRPDYDPDAYQRTYEYLLRHRNSTAFLVDEVFERNGSVYELDNIAGHLRATPEQATKVIRQLEKEATAEEIQAEAEVWYRA